jgi:hypothetical protein
VNGIIADFGQLLIGGDGEEDDGRTAIAKI